MIYNQDIACRTTVSLVEINPWTVQATNQIICLQFNIKQETWQDIFYNWWMEYNLNRCPEYPTMLCLHHWPFHLPCKTMQVPYLASVWHVVIPMSCMSVSRLHFVYVLSQNHIIVITLQHYITPTQECLSCPWRWKTVCILKSQCSETVQTS